MDPLALLGVSGVAVGAAEPNGTCASIIDLQDRLRVEFASKVADTSAHHIAQVFEVRPNVIFHIPVTENENEALENAAAVDPLLGGARSSAVPPSVTNSGHPVRRINALDALTNQPTDDNVLQKSVAKHIISAVSEVDQGSWVIRTIARTDQGWAFTYICKDSVQAWTRQTAKTSAKLPIGAWTGKDGQDPVNLSRPAFDCRGQVSIAFVKTRKIEVKYEHTPMHRSVEQLMEQLAPEPPPPVPIPIVNKKTPKEPKQPKQPKPPKEPKEPKDPKAPKTPRSSRKRQASGDAAADGEGSQPKKRRKKKDGASIAANGAGSGDHLVGPEGSAANGADNLSETREGSSAHGGPNGSVFNVSEEEATRRKNVATQLLSERGIDPESLSTEQFNIFANQSPELQQESLNMLAQYGAERLRIVHPTKSGPKSTQSTTPPESHASSAAAPANQSQAASTDTPKSKRSRKKKPDATPADESFGAEDGQASAVVAGSFRTKGKVKLTRGACESCRTSKVKCDKAKPSCSQCTGAGLACEYAVAKPRSSRGPKADQVESAEESREASIAVEVEVEQQDDEPDSLGSPGFHNEPTELPPSNLVSPALVTPSSYSQPTEIYQHEPGLSFPSGVIPVAPEVADHSTVASADYVPSTVTGADMSLHNYTYPPPVQEPTITYPEQQDVSMQNQNADAGQQWCRTRRALPSSPPKSHGHSNSVGTTVNQENSWQAVSNSPTVAPVATSKPSPRLTKAQQPIHNTPGAQAYDDLRQQPSWSTANHPAPQPAPPSYKSPSQAAAQTVRAKSRQSVRNQSSTPVQNAPASRQSQNQASSTYPATTGVSNPTSVSNYDYNAQSSNNRNEQSNTVAYEPYSSHPAPAPTSNSNPYYGSYGSRTAANDSPAAPPTTVSQTMASSYNTTTATAPSTSEWGSAASNTQPRTRSYNTNPSGSTGTSYNVPPSNTQPPPTLQGLNVRPQPSSQARRSPSTYGHQPQQSQTQPQQPQQPQQPAQQQQQQGYNTYSNPPHNANSSQEQGWYGFNTAGNTPSSYSAASTSGNNAYSSAGSHAHGAGSSGDGSYNQAHHRSMNLSSHTYSSIDGNEALYELLRNNHQQG